MGNSPSKNASPNAHAISSLNGSTTTTTTTSTTGGEPVEPDDRKFSSSNNHNKASYNKRNVATNNGLKTQSYNKNKLQKKKTSKSPKKFTYFNEFNNSSDDTISDENVSPFEMEINLSMAKALKQNSPILNAGGGGENEEEEEEIGGVGSSSTGNGSTGTDEVSSSFSDLFTIDSSISSSLSTTPPVFSNLPPILEEPKIKNFTRKPKLGPNDIDIDSIIEKLLTMSSSSTNSSPVMRAKNSSGNNNDKDEFFIKPYEIAIICAKAREVFLNQPSLLRLSAPVKVVGDIHGQFNDLLRILKLSGLPPNSNYLFLGDYVDRGKQSLETILLLFCFKIKYPENFFMLRGNHESANITKIYGFYDECKRRYNIKLWKTFTDCFNCLPIAAIIDEKIFTMHGGLSPDLNSMEQIRRVMRPTDIPDVGLLCDLLWSDPDKDITGWSENDRGVSFTFGPDVVSRFLQKHDMDLICRAHQVVEDGYEFFSKRQLVTLFSAPNYCGEFDNAGAMMSVDESLLCSFQILKPAEKKPKYNYNSVGQNRNMTPPKKQKKPAK